MSRQWGSRSTAKLDTSLLVLGVCGCVSVGNVAAVIKTGAAAPSWTCCSRPQEAAGNSAARALPNRVKKKRRKKESRWCRAPNWASSHSIFDFGNISALELGTVAACKRNPRGQKPSPFIQQLYLWAPVPSIMWSEILTFASRPRMISAVFFSLKQINTKRGTFLVSRATLASTINTGLCCAKKEKAS